MPQHTRAALHAHACVTRRLTCWRLPPAPLHASAPPRPEPTPCRVRDFFFHTKNTGREIARQLAVGHPEVYGTSRHATRQAQGTESYCGRSAGDGVLLDATRRGLPGFVWLSTNRGCAHSCDEDVLTASTCRVGRCHGETSACRTAVGVSTQGRSPLAGPRRGSFIPGLAAPSLLWQLRLALCCALALVSGETAPALPRAY